MNRQAEIIISGVGGQGMILCGTMIAEAAVTHDHKKATLSSEYGVETRGTFAKSDVIVSDEEIYFPDVTEPDLVVCLAQEAYDRYSGKWGEALILYDAGAVTPNTDRSAFERGVDITGISRGLGNPAVANIVTLGLIVGLTEVITVEGARAAITGFFEKKGERVTGLNLKAFDTGRNVPELAGLRGTMAQ